MPGIEEAMITVLMYGSGHGVSIFEDLTVKATTTGKFSVTFSDDMMRTYPDIRKREQIFDTAQEAVKHFEELRKKHGIGLEFHG